MGWLISDVLINSGINGTHFLIFNQKAEEVKDLLQCIMEDTVRTFAI